MELDLAYAITIHKSQVSEFKAVIIPILSSTLSDYVPPIAASKPIWKTKAISKTTLPNSERNISAILNLSSIITHPIMKAFSKCR